MNLLRELVAKIDATQLQNGELLAEHEVEPNDEVVGVLPEELRRHYAVLRASRADLEKLQKELQGRLDKLNIFKPDDKEQAKKIRQQFDIEASRYEVISNTFWLAVRRTFPEIIDAESIGLRKDWQVVTTKESCHDCDKCPTRETCGLSGLSLLGAILRRG